MKKINYWAFNERGNIDEADKELLSNPKKWLTKQLSGGYAFGNENIMTTGVYKCHAIAYDFRPFLIKFVYKQYGSWTERYAINKTNLRKLTYGKIDKILTA